jgi:Phage capsid protein
MPNPFEIETLSVQYTTRIELLLQQEISRLRGMVDTGTHVGKMASPIQQIAPLEFTQPGARYSDIEFQLSQYVRRWVSPQDRHLPVPIDTFDMLKTIVNPTSSISDAVKAAAERFYDDVIIAAAFATAQTGVDPSSLQSETWPATTFLVSDTFDSASSSGMTYSKIIEGRRILEHYQNDLDRQSVTLVVGSQQNSDMLKQMEVIDKNYNDGSVVEEGRVRYILGCRIISSERLATSSSNTLRNTIMFVRSGMYLGLWKDLVIDVTQRKDKVGYPWQIYGMLSAGATRTQLGKIVQINCADTSSVDPTAP